MTIPAERPTVSTFRVPPSLDGVRRTMERQPADLDRLLRDGWKQARQAAELLDGAERVILTGVGSSATAAAYGAWLFRALGFDARSIGAGDIWLYPDNNTFRCTDAVIVLSHFGMRSAARETLRYAREAGATVLSIGSLTVEHPGSRLILRTVERERSVVGMASHLAALVVLAQVALAYGERVRHGAVKGWREDIEALPATIAGQLAGFDTYRDIGEMVANRRTIALAAGPDVASIEEFRTKAQQAGHRAIESVPLEALLHGPLLSAASGDVGLILMTLGPALERTAEFARAMHTIGMRLVTLGEPLQDVSVAHHLTMPHLPMLLAPLGSLVPLQIISWHVAATLQPDPATFERFVLTLP
jgi:glucosamine 6-phosphate synthetase-like amidotransferase/phosphosugar isomerase protein